MRQVFVKARVLSNLWIFDNGWFERLENDGPLCASKPQTLCSPCRL